MILQNDYLVAIMTTPKRLTRSKDKIIAGVCAGLANHFGLDVSLVRIGFVLIGFITAFVPLTLIYLVMWFVIPQE
ncbi:MAG: PspC domain-containing protein [Cyclobacteriaceae bacterium]